MKFNKKMSFLAFVVSSIFLAPSQADKGANIKEAQDEQVKKARKACDKVKTKQCCLQIPTFRGSSTGQMAQKECLSKYRK